jgi:hypothetical protein
MYTGRSCQSRSDGPNRVSGTLRTRGFAKPGSWYRDHDGASHRAVPAAWRGDPAGARDGARAVPAAWRGDPAGARDGARAVPAAWRGDPAGARAHPRARAGSGLRRAKTRPAPPPANRSVARSAFSRCLLGRFDAGVARRTTGGASLITQASGSERAACRHPLGLALLVIAFEGVLRLLTCIVDRIFRLAGCLIDLPFSLQILVAGQIAS